MRTYALALLAALILPTTATADIVARYDFTGNTGSELFEPPTVVDPNIQALSTLNLTRGSGLQPAKVSNSFASRGWAGPGPNDFLTLTISPLDGYLVQLDSVTMGVLGARADRTLVLRSSLDNFQTNLGSVSFSTTPTNRTISFATPLSFSDPVTFRFITLGANNEGNAYSLTSQSGTAGLVFNGTVTPAAVPEPTSTLLLALAGVTTLGIWRRRTNSV